MNHSDNQTDEELKLIETINRMSSQIDFSEHSSATARHSEFLVEFIEHLEEQLDSIRKSHQVSSTA